MPDTINIERLRLDGGTHIRQQVDLDAVAEYKRIYSDPNPGEALPPLDVFEDDQGELWLADGFTRLEALKQLGRDEAPCEILSGTRIEALWYAAGANAKHGRPLSHEDKRRACSIAWQANPKAGYATIAALVGCDERTVKAALGADKPAKAEKAKPKTNGQADEKPKRTKKRPETADSTDSTVSESKPAVDDSAPVSHPTKAADKPAESETEAARQDRLAKARTEFGDIEQFIIATRTRLRAAARGEFGSQIRGADGELHKEADEALKWLTSFVRNWTPAKLYTHKRGYLCNVEVEAMRKAETA